MYYPFLRAKKHELLALLAIPSNVFDTVLPIVEPVTMSTQALSSYRNLANAGRPFILITNPAHGGVKPDEVQRLLVREALREHSGLVLAYLIEKNFSMDAAKAFLAENLNHKKAFVFRATPRPAEVTNLVNELRSHSEVEYLVFDERRLHTSRAFDWHPRRVILNDGFDRKEKNADYEADSPFPTYIDDIAKMGFAGFGDYLIIGDHFREGGGIGYVVTLHLTASEGPEIVVHHFSSDSDSEVRGLPQAKFQEACRKLVTSPIARALPRTTGLEQYLEWDQEAHFPGLGLPKQASMQHHIEMMSRFV